MATRPACSNRIRASFAGVYAACLALAACGGSAPLARKAESTPHASPVSEASEESSGSASAAPEEEAPKATACEDGTCSACGSGICPSGWYCDESVKGGAACGWLPQCTKKSSCACLTKVLGAGCSCSEQGGGLHVTCR